MNLSAPTQIVFVISLVIAIIGLLALVLTLQTFQDRGYVLFRSRRVRAVTHLDISRDDVVSTVNVVRKLIDNL